MDHDDHYHGYRAPSMGGFLGLFEPGALAEQVVQLAKLWTREVSRGDSTTKAVEAAEARAAKLKRRWERCLEPLAGPGPVESMDEVVFLVPRDGVADRPRVGLLERTMGRRNAPGKRNCAAFLRGAATRAHVRVGDDRAAAELGLRALALARELAHHAAMTGERAVRDAMSVGADEDALGELLAVSRKPLQLRFNMTLYESMRANFVSRSRELVQR